MEKSKERIKWKNHKRILPAILISISIPIILCFAVPFEIYANNIDEFLFGVWDFLPLCLVFGFVLTGINLSILLFIPDRAYKIVSHILLILATLLFIQGTYLNAGLSSLEGDNMGSDGPSIGIKILNIIIWIILIGGAVGTTFIKDKKDIVGKIALFLAGIIIFTQIMVPVFAIFAGDNVFISKEEKLNNSNGTSVAKFISTKNITTLSKSSNIFYFCIDRFDEYYAEEVYKSEPELFDKLDGFTSFKDNISMYGHTFPSVAYMLTNYKYNSELSREQNLNKAYEENLTLKTLHDNGYTINLYGENYYDFVNAGSLPDYVANVSEMVEYTVGNHFLLSLQMICLAMYRCFPLFLKPVFSGINSDSCNLCLQLKDGDGYVNYSSNHKKALNAVQNSSFETVDEGVFIFMHFYGCHDVNFDCKDGTAHPSSGKAKQIKKAVKECFEVINEYIKALKNIGAYENATIIITGDHSAPVNDLVKLDSSRLTALFVKPSGSAGEKLKFSSAPVSHGNIWATIMQSENIQTEEDFGTSLFDVKPEKDTVREYIWQTFNILSLDEYYYEIKGSGRSFGNWKHTKTVHKDKFLMD